MRPEDLVNQLRHIASRIENSSRPSKELVSRELRSVLAAMNKSLNEAMEYKTELTERKFSHLVLNGDKNIWHRTVSPIDVEYVGDGRFVAVDPETREGLELIMNGGNKWHRMVPQTLSSIETGVESIVGSYLIFNE